jgi:hypothetical protein
MASTTGSPEKAEKRDRRARLAEELRANLQRRKAQARARRKNGAGPHRDEPAGSGGSAQDGRREQGE